jgi:SAM-dependent methyltransferase
VTHRPSSSPDSDRVFAGSVPTIYESYLVPLVFEPYAAALVNQLAGRPLRRVLETAAGTGVLTRTLTSVLPESVAIVATDRNQPMLDYASSIGTTRPIEWRQADAMHLPFRDGEFDAVVCQFGVMFFPDKAAAFAEARRVLASGGLLAFTVWDRISENEFADIITAALEPLFPDNPPRFLARTPHAYHDRPTIERDLADGGFTAAPQITTDAKRSRASSPEIPAIGFCQGTPLRDEIEARDASLLGQATALATEAIAQRFGRGAVDGKMQAHIVCVDK